MSGELMLRASSSCSCIMTPCTSLHSPCFFLPAADLVTLFPSLSVAPRASNSDIARQSLSMRSNTLTGMAPRYARYRALNRGDSDTSAPERAE